MKKLKYSFEYFCSPIWIMEDFGEHPIYENIEIINTSLSANLKNELEILDKIYQSTYNDEYPPESKKLSDKQKFEFYKRVLQSSEILKKELSTKYDIIFDEFRFFLTILNL